MALNVTWGLLILGTICRSVIVLAEGPDSPCTAQVLTTVIVSDMTSSYSSSGQSRLGRPSMYVLGSENFLCISLEDIHRCVKLPGPCRIPPTSKDANKSPWLHRGPS